MVSRAQRMEAQYAVQVGLDMIPMMMVADYKPRGWLGMILGSRLYYAFYGELDEREFGDRMDALVREIGDRGRVAEAVPPASAPAPAPVPAPGSALAPAQTQSVT
eukprot:SAG11_NODE_28914_length_316_cov_0.930876_1_plen_104_part_11